MVKKKVFMFIVWAAIVAFVTPVKAQMTDDAVVSYVEAGLSNGKSQDMLIKELATKGVTKEQGERRRPNAPNGETVNQRRHFSLRNAPKIERELKISNTREYSTQTPETRDRLRTPSRPNRARRESKRPPNADFVNIN